VSISVNLDDTTPAGDPERVTLRDGRELTSDAFYRERDQRMTARGDYNTKSFRIALVLGDNAERRVNSHTALFWAASMIRRMGKPFTNLLIIASEPELESEFLGSPNLEGASCTVREALESELLRADPFAEFEWRDLLASTPFADVDIAIWIEAMTEYQGVSPSRGHILVYSRGWVSVIREVAENKAAPERTPRFVSRAATPAVVAAACFAIARIFASVESEIPDTEDSAPWSLWYSIDTGKATTEVTQGRKWEDQGSSADSCAPYNGELASPAFEFASNVMIVGAGGLGWNSALLLLGSNLPVQSFDIIDRDDIDISNLNRLVGLGLDDVSLAKAARLADMLRAHSKSANGAVATYEDWNGERVERINNSIMLLGVDQVGTRLQCQSDWPAILINGATSGLSWSVSSHSPNRGGCVGCWYGSSRQPYSASRRAVACVVQADGTFKEIPEPSYPFATISAAAAMVALAIRSAWQSGCESEIKARRHSINVIRPHFAQDHEFERRDRCLLLCGSTVLRSFFESRDPLALRGPARP
jgi:hypothetical protein